MNIARKTFITNILFQIFLVSLNAHAFTTETYVGTVTRVVDGDTIHFRKATSPSSEKDWKVRMIGIDAPELHLQTDDGETVGQEPWGSASSNYLHDLLPSGTRIQLMTFGKDKYGRVLGRIMKNGVDVNLKMVQEGWAIPYIICDGSGCNKDFSSRQKVATYSQACEQSLEKGKGVFEPSETMTEMPFEFRLRIQKRRPDKYVGDLNSLRLFKPADYDHVSLCNRIFFTSEKQALALGYQ